MLLEEVTEVGLWELTLVLYTMLPYSLPDGCRFLKAGPAESKK